MSTKGKRGISAWIIAFMLCGMILPVLGGTALSQSVFAGSVKKLDQVITAISLWDANNGHYVIQKDGVYQLIKGTDNYQFEVNFDLSEYDGDLNDGDYFTFTIPEPFTVKSTSFELKDKKSGVNVGDVIVTPSGDGKGAVVKITLKNLREYLEKTNGTVVQGVKGTFYTSFSVKEIMNETSVSYNTTETKSAVNHKIAVKEKEGSDYSEVISKENFAKVNGVLKSSPWKSETLDKSGEYLHPFSIRVNTRQASYSNIVVHDYISANHAPAQFIPETLIVRAGYYNSSLSLVDDSKLTAGADYKIEWNSSYTDFKLTILNASARKASNGMPAAYQVVYSTTAPTNGTKIANVAEVSADEQDLTIRTDKTSKSMLIERESKVASGGTIQIDTGYRITIYKQDSDSGNLINGAEFEITSPAGEKEKLEIKSDGYAQSRIYSSEEVSKGQFTIVETKAPPGYKLDPTPIKVNVGKDGVIRTVKNTIEKISIPVHKQWVGKQGEKAEIKLLADGKEKDKITLTADTDWQGVFTELPKYDITDGHEIEYTVAEADIDGYTAGISGTPSDGFTITNTISGKASVPVTKKWIGKKTEKIQVNLLANGEKIDSREISGKENWQYTFTNLDKYKDGKEITYTIEEKKIAGYETSITGDAERGYVITNHDKSADSVSASHRTGDTGHIILYSVIGLTALIIMIIVLTVRVVKRNIT